MQAVMRVRGLLPICCILLFATMLVVKSQTDSGGQANKAEESASRITSQLYGTLKSVVFPSRNSESNDIENRFLLLMPGKVLNYFDYFPGKEYTKFIQEYNSHRRESVVPPHVMEKWFDLADSMPSPNPFFAQETGKSLANVYQSVLHEIKLTGLEEKTQNEQHYYNQGVNFLIYQVQDPEDLSVNITRLALYERYRDEYNDRKLEMEDIIEEKRRSTGSLNYELWFQRHFPSLNSRVESAYTKWIVFGQKEQVELNIAYMDTGSSGQLIEDARATLRASAVESLDRTRKIYPVSFEPSDWYKYLLPKQQRPSRDQLQAIIGKLQSKVDVVDRTLNYITNTNLPSNNDGEYNDAKGNVKTAMDTYLKDMYDCITDPTCKNLNSSGVLEALVDQSDSFTSLQFIDYLVNANGKDEYRQSLERERKQLQNEISQVKSQLQETSPYLGGILDASALAVANLTDEYRNDEWLQFDFFSDSKAENSADTSDTSYKHSSGGGGFFFFGGGGSSTSSSDEKTHENNLATARLRAKGELLRVNIKRPWLKPEVFDDPSLTYVEVDPDHHKTYVSPGRNFEEEEFYRTLTSNDIRYKLPEYTTSFLLARNIELDFAGLDAHTSTYFLSQMSQKSWSGGFLFFHVHHSETKTHQVSNVHATRTATGMNIKIPGAQLIGYFTQVLPKFPQNADS